MHDFDLGVAIEVLMSSEVSAANENESGEKKGVNNLMVVVKYHLQDTSM